MRLLYAGDLWEYGTGLHRMRALERIGFEVTGFDTRPYAQAGGKLAERIRVRILAGRAVARLNRDIVTAATSLRPDFVWFDKPLFVRPATVRALKALGSVTINYVIDNPFSPMPGEPGWRLLRRTIPFYDLNIVPRPSSIGDYRAAGAEMIALMPLAFEPWRDFPPLSGEAVPRTEVSFIGAPWDDRPRFLAALAGRGVPVSVRGAGWEPYRRLAGENLTLGPPAFGDAYRLAIWESKICLGMVTHSHREPWAHRAFEITASGGLLLGERSSGHLASFREGIEAEFFESVEEAADKAAFYRRNDDARASVARAGCRRAWRSGYSNDERIARAFSALDPGLGGRLAAAAAAVIAGRRSERGIT